VHLRQAGQDVLPRRLGALELERRILVHHALYRVEDLLLLAARLRPDRERRRRLRQFYGWENHLLIGLAQSVEGVGVLELGDGDDIPCDRLVHGATLLTHEVVDAPEPLGGARARIYQCLIRATPSAHDPQYAKTPGVRVLIGLEHVGAEGSIGVAQDLFAPLVCPARTIRGARGAAR
jgi:hypothetical protein